MAKARVQRQQRSLVPPHRPHRVGQHQSGKASRKAQIEDRDHVRVHERLAAGERDLAGGQLAISDLIEIRGDLGERQIHQCVVARRAFDIAALAGQVAQGAGVEPERLQRGHRDAGARLALGGDQRIAELGRIERGRVGNREGAGGIDSLYIAARPFKGKAKSIRRRGFSPAAMPTAPKRSAATGDTAMPAGSRAPPAARQTGSPRAARRWRCSCAIRQRAG